MKLNYIAVLALALLASSPATANGDEVSLQLLWKNQFQFAGYYVAKEKGFYKGQGLDVDIREFSNQTDLVGDVLRGESTFAVGRSSLIVDRAKGAPIIALMAAFQQSPLMLLTKKSSGISSPEDLRGRRVMMTDDAEQVAEVLAMLLRAGVMADSFVRQPHSFQLEDLIENRTDAYGAYLSNEPFQLQARGVEYKVIHPRDYGFDMYSDILFTSQEYLLKEPAKVNAFLHASLRGWEYAFSHIEETAELIHRQYNTQSRSLDALVYEGQALKELAYAGVEQFGEISANRFHQMANIYLITGALDKAFNLDGFVYTPPRLDSGIQLTQTQMHYLWNNRNFKLCVNPSGMPYDGVVDGQHQGVVSGYMRILAKKLDIQLELMQTASLAHSLDALERGQCQLLAGAMQTNSWADKFKYSKPYLSLPMSLAVRDSNVEFDLSAGPYAVISGSAFAEIIKHRYPHASLIEVPVVAEGLHLVAKGNVAALVANKASIHHHLGKLNLSGIISSSRLNDNWDISVVARADDSLLIDILNQGISNLSSLDHQAIRNRWVVAQEVEVFDRQSYWMIVGAISLIIIFLGYRYYVISGYNRRLQQLASCDQLTGVSNRHSLSGKLDDQIRIAARYQRKLSIIFFDIDNFKHVNDTYGHIAGDEVLMDIAREVSVNIRKADFFGRWGGDEFMVILPEQDIGCAALEAEKLRTVIAEHIYPYGGKVSCSFGIAEFHEDMTEDTLLVAADNALYESKEKGRNRVTRMRGYSEYAAPKSGLECGT
ncbi:MAG: ABC transporter substrate-binding protein [Motiliproteus sp.]